jgi:hypothetical protein
MIKMVWFSVLNSPATPVKIPATPIRADTHSPLVITPRFSASESSAYRVDSTTLGICDKNLTGSA